MDTVLLIIHVLIALGVIGVVLLQRSEGGALGIGGGGGGGFMTGRGAANFLTRITAGLAAAFFVTSLLLSMIGSRTVATPSILDRPAGTGKTVPAKAPGAPGTTEPPKDGPKLPSIDLKNLPGTALPDAPKTGTPEPPRVPESK